MLFERLLVFRALLQAGRKTQANNVGPCRRNRRGAYHAGVNEQTKGERRHFDARRLGSNSPGGLYEGICW
jgi:hypothetical protein